MKKYLTIIGFAFITLNACKKNEPFPVVPPVSTIKYELISTASLKDTSVNASIYYTDANGQLVKATNFLPGATTWTKTITIDASRKPFSVNFKSEGANGNYLYYNAAGDQKVRITYNGGYGAYETSTMLNGPGYHKNSFSLSYVAE